MKVPTMNFRGMEGVRSAFEKQAKGSDEMAKPVFQGEGQGESCRKKGVGDAG